MYRVTLVDDEPWALAGLRKIFKWHESQFEISGETTNSVEALYLIRQQKPDAVFTDIRMPEISGIELMKLIRGEGLDTEFVIISGFAEFSYAQESLRLGAFDYRLKPLQLEETNVLLNSLWQHLENRYSAGKNLPEDPVKDCGYGEYINPDFRRLLVHIGEHYQQELSLSELAEKFHLNPTYCSELFRKITRKTYSEYLSGLRIEQARRFLDSTTMALEDIAYRVGFSDYYYFSKVFKKITGLPPLRYRKKKSVRDIE
jgi:YesN/AraC family two-component response regulator